MASTTLEAHVVLAPLMGRLGLTAELCERIRSSTPGAWGRTIALGCGTGQAFAPLMAIADEFVGVDRNEMMCELARRTGSTTWQAEAHELPTRDRTWDCAVVATGVLDCASDEQVRHIGIELRRVVRDEGRAWLVHFDHSDLDGFYERWNLVQDGKVLRDRKLDLWMEMRAAGGAREPAIRRMCAFFDAAAERLEELGLGAELLGEVLPPWQRVRTPADLTSLVAGCGWQVTGSIRHPPSRAFALCARPTTKQRTRSKSRIEPGGTNAIFS